VEVDAEGRYFRVGTTNPVYIAPDPNLVRMADDGTFYVDFRGIPVVGVEATLTSPVLSDGQLDSRECCNHRAAPVFFTGTVQDELVLRGFYTGLATDPNTGEQYRGTFEIRAQGPRYSDRSGGNSPTVFDFQSHYNFAANPQLQPTPTVDSVTFADMPVRLRVTVPSDLSPVVPAVPSEPATPSTPTVPNTVPNAVPDTPSILTGGLGTPVTPPTPSLPNAPTVPAPEVVPVIPAMPVPQLPSVSALIGAAEITAADYVIWQERAAEAEPFGSGPRSRVMLW